MDNLSYISETCDCLSKILVKLPESLIGFYDAVDLIKRTIKDSNKIIICGNGGSQAQAEHFAAELVVRYRKGGRSVPIAAIALGSSSAILTATGNDYGYFSTFAREVKALGRPGYVLVAISSSGESTNILRAIDCALSNDMRVIGLTGLKGMDVPCTVDLRVPSIETARIQEAHLVIIHSICEALEDA